MTSDFNLTDVGNAHRLVSWFGGSLLYVAAWGKWLIWDGSRWAVDETKQHLEYGKRTAERIYAEAHRLEGDPRSAARTWAVRSESVGHVRAMLELASSDPRIAVTPSELDRNPMLLCTGSGTLDLLYGRLRPHDPNDRITKKTPVVFDPAADCPTWLAVLDRVAPDEDVRTFLQRAFGYSLTGLTIEQVLFFLYGIGANGKSTLLDVLLATLGEYGDTAPADLLLVARDAHPTGVASLFGLRVAVTSEMDEGRRLAEGLVKSLTGGDRVKARRMREDFWAFDPTHKLWIGANHRPVVRGTDHALWRRQRVVPFDVVIPPEEQDKRLRDRLHEELPGILRWAVEGCLAWQEGGLTEPLSVQLATHDYRAEMDVLGGFLADECVTGSDLSVSARDIYKAYERWCDDNGEKPVSQRRLGLALTERGFDRGLEGSGPNRARCWLGIALADQSVVSMFGRESAS